MSTFYIPKPCQENWDRMSPADQGKHCAVCQKTVIDFTDKTPAEIDTLYNGAQSDVCGRFTFGQLNRAAQIKAFRNPRNLFNGNWKYFALSFFGFLAFSKKAQAQEPMGGAPMPVSEPSNNTDSIKITGTVLCPDRKPAGGAKITFTDNGKLIGETNALANGTYVYRIPPGKISGKTIDITVSYTGFPKKVMNDLPLSGETVHLNIIMGNLVKLMGVKKKAP